LPTAPSPTTTHLRRDRIVSKLSKASRREARQVCIDGRRAIHHLVPPRRVRGRQKGERADRPSDTFRAESLGRIEGGRRGYALNSCDNHREWLIGHGRFRDGSLAPRWELGDDRRICYRALSRRDCTGNGEYRIDSNSDGRGGDGESHRNSARTDGVEAEGWVMGLGGQRS